MGQPVTARLRACFKNHFIVAADVRRLKIQRVSGEIRASSRRLLQFQNILSCRPSGTPAFALPNVVGFLVLRSLQRLVATVRSLSLSTFVVRLWRRAQSGRMIVETHINIFLL